jgi:hypothetical protein
MLSLQMTPTLVGVIVFILSITLRVEAATCYGPNTCLEGWVWRQAVADDYVCVTPATRTQTEQDNAAAASRVNPAGGPFGPNTCSNGYVWRQAVPTDYVCVLPATRSQAVADNAQAANRRASLDLWVTAWAPEQPPCTGPVCSEPSGGEAPLLQVNGDHFNYGSVLVGIFSLADNTPLQPVVTVQGRSQPPYVGGAIYAQLNIAYCSGSSNPPNAMIQAFDEDSACFSQPFHVYTECTFL